MQASSNGRIEDAANRPAVLVGITGHRDVVPDDVPLLIDRLGSELKRLIDACRPAPVLAISPLAEGADRLFAREALKRGLPLLVVLPMRKELYETDFLSQVSRNEFQELLNQAALVVERPLVEGATEEQVRVQGEARDRQYESANVWMAARAHVLFALWNGRRSGLVGGTTSVVEAFLRGANATAGSGGLLIHIVTPRVSSADCDGVPYEVRMRTTERWREGGYSHILERVRDFNRDLDQLGRKQDDLVERSMKDFLPPEYQAGLPPRARRLLRAYSIADAVAIRLKKRWYPLLIVLVVLSLLAFGAYEVHAHLVPGQPLILLATLGFLMIAWVLWHRYEKKGRLQDRFLDYRALAEGLRVQFLWTVFGIDKDASVVFHRNDTRELDWIWHAISGIDDVVEALDEETGLPPPVCERALELVRESWIPGQLGFFERAAKKEDAKDRRLLRAFRASFAGAIVVLTTMTLGGLLYPPSYEWWDYVTYPSLHEWPGYHWLILGAGIPFLAAAMLEFIRGRLSYDEHVRQYRRMANSHRLALHDLEKARDGSEVCRVVECLGRKALEETADWVLTHRTRPLDLPPP